MAKEKLTVTRKYHEIRKELDTGDIVIFSEKGGVSAGSKWVTGSKWSHVGMVVKLEAMDMVVLWGSTTLSDLADVETGRAKEGVQLVVLSDRISRYKGASPCGSCRSPARRRCSRRSATSASSCEAGRTRRAS